MNALIISAISPFEMNQVNTFPALKVPLPILLLPNLSNLFKAAFKAILLVNPGKTSLAKGIATFVSAFLANSLSNLYQNHLSQHQSFYQTELF